MRVSTLPTLKLLIASTLLYILIAIFAGLVAITRNLPAEFLGISTGRTAAQDFVFGIGTALSPPLSTLVIQFLLLLLALRGDRWGVFGILGLALIGLATFIGALGERINMRVFNLSTFDILEALLMSAMILLPLAIMVFSLMEWRRRKG